GMSAWLGPIIVHWPALFLPLARALTELHAFCAFKLSFRGMSSAGYPPSVNSPSAALTADGPFSTDAVSFSEPASGSPLFARRTADPLRDELLGPNNTAAPTMTSQRRRRS